LIFSNSYLLGDDGEEIEAQIVELVGDAIDKELSNQDWERVSLLRKASRAAGTCVNSRSQQPPMIMPVIIDT
jgi:hypothetical protein